MGGKSRKSGSVSKRLLARLIKERELRGMKKKKAPFKKPPKPNLARSEENQGARGFGFPDRQGQTIADELTD